jgi:16S rRNA (uracil1498-N3)-methyltransferase
MSRPRLHIDDQLGTDRELLLDGPRAHYLTHVLRLRRGADVHVFNVRDGEFRARLHGIERHGAQLRVAEPLRPPAAEPGPSLAFAPIKRNRLEWLVEKATELGVARFCPVITERTVVKLDRPERLQAIVTEAAEQCGRLTVPAIDQTLRLGSWLVARPPGRPLLLLDETGGGRPLMAALPPDADCDILLGPEGGFAPGEITSAASLPDVRRVDLGPLILRSETAAIMALAAWRVISAARA